MGLLQDCIDVGLIDDKTLLPLGKGGGRDNFPVTTAMLCALASPVDREAIRPYWNNYLADAVVPGYSGVFHREKGNTDFNSVDNYIGIIRVCQILEMPGPIQAICHHGETHDWVFDNTAPDRGFVQELKKNRAREWFGRMLGFPAYVTYAAKGKLSCWEQLAFSLAVQTDAPDDNTLAFGLINKADVGNSLLQWHELCGMEDAGFFIRSWAKAWKKRKTKLYTDLAGMNRYYFKPIDGKEHPFTAASHGREF